ncbi:hypothetical protein GGX14DRAFT_394479 [Mycena pura]|uniref:Uncharacterized protein n=1 Tax=Mycena pura TaxID=153505 RepID=A0AAD6VET1_9AGAR|nr:hypothetical protein GGX14DRAFT_394479 [Mycena pura]
MVTFLRVVYDEDTSGCEAEARGMPRAGQLYKVWESFRREVTRDGQLQPLLMDVELELKSAVVGARVEGPGSYPSGFAAAVVAFYRVVAATLEKASTCRRVACCRPCNPADDPDTGPALGAGWADGIDEAVGAKLIRRGRPNGECTDRWCQKPANTHLEPLLRPFEAPRSRGKNLLARGPTDHHDSPDRARATPLILPAGRRAGRQTAALANKSQIHPKYKELHAANAYMVLDVIGDDELRARWALMRGKVSARISDGDVSVMASKVVQCRRTMAHGSTDSTCRTEDSAQRRLTSKSQKTYYTQDFFSRFWINITDVIGYAQHPLPSRRDYPNRRQPRASGRHLAAVNTTERSLPASTRGRERAAGDVKHESDDPRRPKPMMGTDGMPNLSHRYNLRRPPKIAEVVGDDEQSGVGKVGTSLDVEDDDELHPAGDIHHSTWLSPLKKISPGSSSAKEALWGVSTVSFRSGFLSER